MVPDFFPVLPKWTSHQTTITVAFVTWTAAQCNIRRVPSGRSMETGCRMIGAGYTFAGAATGHCGGCLQSLKKILISSTGIGSTRSTCSSWNLRFPNSSPSETYAQLICNHFRGCHCFFSSSEVIHEFNQVRENTTVIHLRVAWVFQHKVPY